MRGWGEEVKPLVSVPCEAMTKKKRPCPNNAHQTDGEGKWLCHVHNPTMLFRKQQKAKHEERYAEEISRRKKREARIVHRAQPWSTGSP